MSLTAPPAPTGLRPSAAAACIAQGLGSTICKSRSERLEGSLIEFSLRSCTIRTHFLFEVATIFLKSALIQGPL